MWKEGGARFKLQTEAVLFTLSGYILQDMNDEAIGIFEKHDALKQTNKRGVIV